MLHQVSIISINRFFISLEITIITTDNTIINEFESYRLILKINLFKIIITKFNFTIIIVVKFVNLKIIKKDPKILI